MVNLLNGFLYGLGGLVCTCMVLLVTLQEKMVYVPVLPGMSKRYPITPSNRQLKYDDVWLWSEDGVLLHSWFIKADPRVSGPTILFFQENAGNIAHRLDFADLMLHRLHCNLFMLSYRGYGESEGYPSQKGLILDAQAALDHLLQRSDIDHNKIFVFGRSLGGAVASALVNNNPGKVSGLILENTFTSVLDMAGVMLPILKWVIGGPGRKGVGALNFLVRSPWNTLAVVGRIRAPILYMSGLRDEMVPPSHMRQLYAASHANNRNSSLVEFPTGMHMDTWVRGGDRYWRVLQLFIDQHSTAESYASSTAESEVDQNSDTRS